VIWRLQNDVMRSLLRKCARGITTCKTGVSRIIHLRLRQDSKATWPALCESYSRVIRSLRR
jgi:hypothetical protein